MSDPIVQRLIDLLVDGIRIQLQISVDVKHPQALRRHEERDSKMVR